ncbi:hypothetical protein DO97_05840 [Neosynechococcus sphagnicola sy1]|uniref:Uncharacterized protein n=1 Tax=Neosynechococcus sphagnicola sy1 TaxID=1497020 RepID=A0A098TNP3_9CYAN|nr:hypothetical protein [Neosynechococcus sphagnicola]KGF73881.1 hypothetical protein DO97_05840 [Neosynechococcus sphagnicola sy1]
MEKILFGILCSIFIYQSSAKAIEVSTKATFASIQATGVIPIADKPVLVIPCSPINTNCKEVVNYITQVIQDSQNLNDSQIEDLNQNIIVALKSLKQVSEVRTDLKGEVQIPCKVSNCLIYTNWTSTESKLFWISIHEKGTAQEYPPSKAVQLISMKIPEDIIRLNEAISRLKAQLSAGVTYVDFPNAVTPFIQALNSAQSSPEASDYVNYTNEANRISNMISILSRTWGLYIKSTSVSGFTTTHHVSCKTAKAIRELWNDAIGYDDMTEIKGGLLGCLFVDLDRFSSPYGNTTWPRYMLQVVSIKLERISNFTSKGKRTVPVISLPQVDANKF